MKELSEKYSRVSWHEHSGKFHVLVCGLSYYTKEIEDAVKASDTMLMAFKESGEYRGDYPIYNQYPINKKNLDYGKSLISHLLENKELRKKRREQKLNKTPKVRSKNARNCSPSGGCKYLGVGKQTGRATYRAMIRINGKNKYLGSDIDPVKCALMYDKAATEHHGEFANLNFPK